jgi:cytochrome c oxidase subunit 3
MSHDFQYGSTGKPHPFHIVNPSPWPMLASLAAGLTAFGAVMGFHEKGFLLSWIGGFALIAIASLWFRDIIREATHDKVHSVIAKLGFRYGMLLFIASEVMFFVAFFWAFFDASLFPKDGIGNIWPPAGITTIAPFDLPFLMTMILLLSGCTCTWAHGAVIEGKQKEAVMALAVTVGLGIIFTGFQAFEYHHATFKFTDTVYASTFYMATGFHGFHVLIGTIFLAVCLWRAAKGHFKPNDHFGFEAAAWYWHFVDVVWLFLFIAVYWHGGQ